MKEPTLPGYIKDSTRNCENGICTGPFVTISRQFGCYGDELTAELARQLNEGLDEPKWKIYGKDVLKKLAEQSGHSVETLEKARIEKTGFMREILKNIRTNVTPDTYQVRSQIALMVRQIAEDGHAIILGQGGAAATSDMANGLNIRIEAPLNWRVLRVCRRENLSRNEALCKIKEVDRTRHYLRQTYSQVNPRVPAFHMMLDNSKFTQEQTAEQIILAMKHCGMIE